MSPRKSRQAAIQATKSLTTAKKQPARAKKKPEPKKVVKKKQPQKPKTTSKKTKRTETTRNIVSKTDTQVSSENKPKKKTKRKYKITDTNRRKVITQDRLLTVINQIGGTVGEPSEKALRTETEEILLTQAVQEQEDVENGEIEPSDQRTIYSCKFCNKDFSSAFILFLHIRIHEKVGNVPEVAVKDEPEQPTVDEKYLEEDSDDEPEIKEEIIEEITIPDIDDDDDDDEDVKPAPENDPLQSDQQPKTEFVGIINKNFVENLKKNLSLAMSRQVN